MNTTLKYFVLAFLFSWNLQASSTTKTIQVDFYSEKISVDYQSDIILPGLLIAEDISLMEYFKKMEQTSYEPILKKLFTFKDQYQLNDWLYYELLKAVVEKIYKREDHLKKDASLWFLLTKSGYDTRLSYLNDKIYIYAWSNEDIFETPMIIDENKKFINLSSVNKAKQSPNELKLLLFKPGAGEQSFSFKLEKLPQLAAQIQEREIEFRINDRSFRIVFNMDGTLYEIMKNYPAIAEKEYFNIPLSMASYSSLIPKLKFMIKDKSTSEALKILVAFTRTGFKYKDDQEVFGRSKPMIAEELFHYQYSDCEDRSVLFYYLVKEILDLPMLIIAYSDHLTIAVASDEISGQAIHFEGLKYYICDPTGPEGSNIIGSPPSGYENTSFEIIGTYNN